MIQIRPMKAEDTEDVLAQMKSFYASPAVFYEASEEVFRKDIADCIGPNPFIDGYVFEDTETAGLAGYAMVAKGYTTEFGGVCLWLEDLHVKEAYRGQGIGTKFFAFLKRTAKADGAVRLRLEAEAENEGAVKLYKREGFREVPYLELDRLL